jgi:hypothetical protein
VSVVEIKLKWVWWQLNCCVLLNRAGVIEMIC